MSGKPSPRVDTDHATRDEALAVALAESEPGEVVIVHDTACESDEDGPGCPCQPMVLRVGAAA